MRRTNEDNQFYKPETGFHNVEIKNVHPKAEKSTRWEFTEMVDGNVETFSLFLNTFSENIILRAFGYEAKDGKIEWDEDQIIGKPVKIELSKNGDFLNLKSATANKLNETEIPF